jgi:hypothetical protein
MDRLSSDNTVVLAHIRKVIAAIIGYIHSLSIPAVMKTHMFPAHFIYAISQWLSKWIKLEIKLETPGVRASNYSNLDRDKVE